MIFALKYAHAAHVSVRLGGVFYGTFGDLIFSFLKKSNHMRQSFPKCNLTEMIVAFLFLFGGFAASALAEDPRHNLTWFGYSS